MAIKIDSEVAKQVLLRANANRLRKRDQIGKNIETILFGSHKTYRYVLVTALLAKATDEVVDILSLQAKDESEGAYDARSICHKVLVPFERNYYPNSIGGSNEPFLNKPARFTRLTTENAVRAGKDYETLVLLINTLSSIQSKEDAFSYLCSAIDVMSELEVMYRSQFSVDNISFKGDGKSQAILDYIYKLTDKILEGETCPLIVSTIEQLYLGESFIVKPHKVNESGASSKEVGDIDVFDTNEQLVESIEIKDKDFTKEDVGHAISKFIEAKLDRSMFVYGKNVVWDKEEVYQLVGRIGRTGHYCCVISVLDYAKLRIMNISRTVNLKDFSSLMLQFAKTINAKDETINWLKECLTEIE